jgi:eukaryotic-like serine/threonine-protein kinase
VQLNPGDRVDRFVLRARLGEGGQGAVWKADDPLAPGLPCALKLVAVNPARPNDVERARREARALARLDHPSLVKCHGLFEDLRLGLVGVVMDFVDGMSLRDADADPRLGPDHRAAVLRHVSGVLAYLHDNGVVHRDLKQDNVLVKSAFFSAPEEPANVKLVDLGIASVKDAPGKLTALGTVVGTVAYLAPEQLDPASFGADESSPAIDVFAFGVLGWQLLTGQHPTGLPPGATLVDFVRAYREAAERAAWPTAAPDGEWGELLTGALQIQQRDRIPNGSELATRCLASSAPVIVRPAADQRVALESAPTSVASPGAMRDPTAAATVKLGPVVGAALPERPRSAAWIWAVLAIVLLGAAGVFWLRSDAPPPPLPSFSGTRAPLPIASDLPARLTPEAAIDDAADDSDSAKSECCPSGRDCGPGRCTDPLEPDEGWHLRLAEIPLHGDRPLSETHSNGEVCVKISDVALWTCTPVSELVDGGAPFSKLYVTRQDLTEKGIDVLVRFSLADGVKPMLAQTERITLPGASRVLLCKGLELAMSQRNLPIAGVRFYLDADDTAVAPPRTVCP